jgi:hypothetical protein
MLGILGEQRKSRKASPLNNSTTPSHGQHSHPVNAPGSRPSSHRQAGNQTPAAAHTIQAFPSEQPQSRTASLIWKTYRNPKRHKKILAQKGLDKVYISYQSAMTTT